MSDSPEVLPIVAPPAMPKRQSVPGLALMCILSIVTIVIAAVAAPAETIASVTCTAVMASALMRRRYHDVLVAANRVTRAFMFDEGLLADELRELSKTVFLWEGK